MKKEHGEKAGRIKAKTALALCASLLCMGMPGGAPGIVTANFFADAYVSNRLVTPNGDGRNDTFVFKCYNPRDLFVSGKIFDLSGRQITEMRLINISMQDFSYDLEWNPDLSGSKIPGGVYIYQISAGGSHYTGTVVVTR